MGDLSNEPTMEDILSSIKKIIAEDSSKTISAPRARKFGPQDDPVPAPPVASPGPEAAVPAETVPAEPVPEEDILELTQTAETTAAVAAQPETFTLVSEDAAVQSRSALDQLSSLIVKPEVAGNDTLEGMVREMLRPMLKDWLDGNLPRLVEAMVSREIARISGRSLI